MRAVIMAAGKSTRTYPLTLTRPKPLLPLANRPILEHQLDALEGLVDSVVLIVGYLHEMIRARMGDRYKGMRIEYVVQEAQRGTGHAALLAEDLIDAPFLLLNGDDLYAHDDLARVAAAPNQGLAHEVDDPSQYGIFDVRDDGTVIRLVEKPPASESRLANMGVYALTPTVFDILRGLPESPRGEIEVTDAIQDIADSDGFRVFRAEGCYYPISYPWHVLPANAYLLDQLTASRIECDVHPLAAIEGHVHIGEGTRVRAGAVIDGPVVIGNHCEIGPNCWLRPYSVIGDHCKVGQGVEIKNTIVMSKTKLPHLSYAGDSVIGESVNFGCGTVTSNYRHDGQEHRSMVKGKLVGTGRNKLGAIIGDHVHTGINTSFYPGRKMWPHTSTRPGEVVQYDKME